MKDLLARIATRQENATTAAVIMLKEVTGVVERMKEWHKNLDKLSRNELTAIVYIADRMKANVDAMRQAQGVAGQHDKIEELDTQVVIMTEIASDALTRISQTRDDIDVVLAESQPIQMAYTMMDKAMNTTQMLYGEEIRSIQRGADKEGLFLYLRDGQADDIIKAIKRLPKDKIIEIIKGLK